MTSVTLNELTQEQVDSAAEKVIAGIKSAEPRLDTREGTVLRSLLVNPEAQMEALTEANIDRLRVSTSLKRLKEAEDDGMTIDGDDVDGILANFNLTTNSGRVASGIVKITVNDDSVVYSIPAGTEFSTVDGIVFTSPAEAVTAVTSEMLAGMGAASMSGAVKIYKGAAGFFFLVPVSCTTPGIEGNISQGTVLTTQYSIRGLISIEAYKSFDGGADTPDIAATIAAIPSGLSIRGFVSRTACEGMLRSQFDSGQYPMVAVSVAGYGDGVQRRDKHNLFGVGVGGRLDLYVRNFVDLYTVTKTVEGVRTADGRYDVRLLPDDFPGSCWVKSVADPYFGSDDNSEQVLSPLRFAAERTSVGADATRHDFDVSRNASETANTIWQGFLVHVFDVAPDVNTSDSSSSDDAWSESREFKVTCYCLPQAVDIQAYVDDPAVSSVSSDVVVRCPYICNVTVSATVRYDADNPMDEDGAKDKIRAYINSRGFVGRLTRSEIVHILKDCGAVSVDLVNKDMLYGVLHDAMGVEHVLQGDALDVSAIADDEAMISKQTVVFAAEPQNIQLKMIAA